MTEEQKPHPPDGLQFDKVVPHTGAAGQTTCKSCNTLLSGSYFSVNAQVICPPCKKKIESEMALGHPLSRVMKALALGIPAGIVGAAIYYIIRLLTGYEFGLIAVLIGYMVGFSVRKGSNHRGGIPYQIIAVLITYMAICSTYVPNIINEWKTLPQESAVTDTSKPVSSANINSPEKTSSPKAASIATPAASPASPRQPTLAWYIVAFVLSLAVPFLMGFQNVIGLLIIGFGLFEAGRMNKKASWNFEGPFELKS